jgi:hypothetical protein
LVRKPVDALIKGELLEISAVQSGTSNLGVAWSAGKMLGV